MSVDPARSIRPVPRERPDSRGAHLALGRHGEDLAAAWYLERGYELIARNWRCPAGELDLVLRTGSTVVFCEVKTRTSERFGSPFEAVDRRRQGRLRSAALEFLRCETAGARSLRFDVAGVIGSAVEVRQDAF
ncbi:MAG: YraN family protein [Microthrixaceae bacterium]